MVVTPGSRERAFQSFFIHDDADDFRAARDWSGREARNICITSSLSAICLTCFGETKLTASMCLKPARTSSFKIFRFVGSRNNFAEPLPRVARTFDRILRIRASALLFLHARTTANTDTSCKCERNHCSPGCNCIQRIGNRSVENHRICRLTNLLVLSDERIADQPTASG